MDADRVKWDAKHAAAAVGEPAAWVTAHLPLVPVGRALDLACGLGRHALAAARAGFAVDAVDISPTALARLDAPGITTHEADLDTYRPAAGVYDLVICTFFLDRRLWPAMAAALRPGGWLLAETFLAASQRIETSRFKLQPDELRLAFPDLVVHAYRENGETAALAAYRSV